MFANFFRQSVGWGYVLTLGMVSVLDFFVTNLKLSHGF